MIEDPPVCLVRLVPATLAVHYFFNIMGQPPQLSWSTFLGATLFAMLSKFIQFIYVR